MPVDSSVIRILMPDTLVTQLTHINLKSKKRENHQTENGEGHDFRELLETVQEGIDDGLEA